MIELLAFLLQQEPEVVPVWLDDLDPTTEWPEDWEVTTQYVLPTNRRPDVLLQVPGQAVVLVEVKLGSGEGQNQLADYAAHLRGERSEPVRRLVYLARDAAAATTAARHGTTDVPVYPATWQRLQQLFAAADAGPLADDFAEMLREEGLAMPEPLSASEFSDWEAGARVMQRLQLLLDAARPGLETLLPDQNWIGPLRSTTERIYRLFASDQTLYGVGFNPGSLWGHAAIIDFYILNKTLEAGDRRRTARELRDAHPELVSWVEWGETPKRSRPAVDILTGATFNQQADQVVSFARESLDLFRAVGYATDTLL